MNEKKKLITEAEPVHTEKGTVVMQQRNNTTEACCGNYCGSR